VREIARAIMRITKIEKQKHRQTRYSIFLDGKYAFHLDKDVLSDSKWREGHNIDEAEVRRVSRLEQIKEARDYAFRLLSYRSRSSQEMLERLLKKGYENEIVQEVVKDLKRLNYLDDLSFARDWVEARLKQNRGRILIRRELLKKGIDREVIENSIAQGLKKIDSSEDELAWQAIEKRISRYQKLDKTKAYRRIKDFLIRRGFSLEATQNTLDRFFQDYLGDSG